MASYLIRETPASDGPQYVLWYRERSAVWVLPWGSRDRRDIQAVGRSLVELGSPFGDPNTQSGLIVAGALRHANGRQMALFELDEAEREAIARTIAGPVPEADSPVAQDDLPPVLKSEVLTLVGQRLVVA